MATSNDGENSANLVHITDKTRYWYIGLLALTIALLILGLCYKTPGNVIIAVPVIILLTVTLIRDKKFIHVPPMIIFIVVAAMALALLANYFNNAYPPLDIAADVMKGVVLSTGGLIIAYIALGQLPGFAKEKPGLIALESFAIGVAVAALWAMLANYISHYIPDFSGYGTLDEMMAHLAGIYAGCAIISLLFYLDIYGGFYRMAIIGFLDDNSKSMGIEQDEVKEVEQLIDRGESYELEFKSTLCTNLRTGNKDKRMEKAVLKTLVAFLNSDGGTLLVGVDDDGNILGVDVEGFDNRDKMNLHITSLLSSQIGDEFIPFIKYKQICFGKKDPEHDKVVIKFTCKPTNTPVFLKDGKQEIYYIRSGPSSVELTGNNLIKYVDNRKKIGRRRHAIPVPTEPPKDPDESTEENPEKKEKPADKPQ